jgi:hypothetical protein
VICELVQQNEGLSEDEDEGLSDDEDDEEEEGEDEEDAEDDDGGGGGQFGDADADDDDSSSPVITPNQVMWFDLSAEQRSAAQDLGYTVPITACLEAPPPCNTTLMCARGHKLTV